MENDIKFINTARTVKILKFDTYKFVYICFNNLSERICFGFHIEKYYK